MWRTVKISDVCEFQSGLWKGKKTPFTKANVIRHIYTKKKTFSLFDNIFIKFIDILFL